MYHAFTNNYKSIKKTYMKSFKSKKSFKSEAVGYSKMTTYVVENDIDRNNLPEDKKWSDLFPEVNIDGIVYKTRLIQGHNGGLADPINLNKNTLIGICVL